MKVIEKGPGWSLTKTCTGIGNGGGGCGAKLQVESSDLFKTITPDERYVSFKCVDCGILTDVGLGDVPASFNLPHKEDWLKL